MSYDVESIAQRGPEQAMETVVFRLTDGSTMTYQHALALAVHHGAKFRIWLDGRWKELRVIHRKVFLPAFDL